LNHTRVNPKALLLATTSATHTLNGFAIINAL